MAETTTIASSTPDSSGYWKFCSIVLGSALVLSLILGSGPSSASASSSSAVDPYANHPNVVEPMLRIGGFDAIEGVPMFVMVDQTGQRVGVMEMPSKTEE